MQTRVVMLPLVASALAPTIARAAEPICSDPAVIYCNDFEVGLDGLEAGARATIASAGDGAPTFDGGGSLLADFTPPYGAEAEFGHRFAGAPEVYLRFYVRFDATWTEPMHHFYAIHGDRDDDMWSCHGDAGCRPNGTLCLSGTTVDTHEVVDGQLPGQPFFYTYHPEMNCDPGDSCANYADPQEICDGCAAKGLPCEMGLECCWGENYDVDDTTLSLVADTWYAFETRVRANTPGVADGEMALWIDGVMVGQRGGIRWRDDPGLLLNHVIVWNYYPESQAAHSIWFDNLVISTAPIGTLGDPSGDEGSSGGGGGGDGGGSTTGVAGGDSGGVTASGEAGGSAAESGSTTAPAAGEGGGADAGGCGCADQRGRSGAAIVIVVLALSRPRRGRASDEPRA
ncbi:MAG: hypothetical protein U0168_27200 [Nannocystaceae bacterium]